MDPPRDGGTKICLNGPGHMTNMAAMPIYGKNMKNSSSLEPKADDLGRRYSNDNSGSTLTCFMVMSNFVHYAFVWEQDKTIDFSETIVVYDIKIGRCSQLNENMKLMSTKGQGHSLTLVQISDSVFLNIFSSITTRPMEAKFQVGPLWDRGTKATSNSPGHMTEMATMPIHVYGKNRNLLHWSRKADDRETWCAASSTTKFVRMMSWVDLELFYGIVKFGPLCFCMGKS